MLWASGGNVVTPCGVVAIALAAAASWRSFMLEANRFHIWQMRYSEGYSNASREVKASVLLHLPSLGSSWGFGA